MKNIDHIQEAKRYLFNAKETLSKSPIEYGRYTDSKYVREASGIAYLAALEAIDAYLLERGMLHKQLPKSIEEYWVVIKKSVPINGKLYSALTIVYENLHLFAYYRKGTSVALVKDGLENVKKIIEMMSLLLSKNNGNDHTFQVNESSVPYRKKSVYKKKK